MNTLDKELYTKQAKRLGAIINAQSPFAKYLQRQDFIKILGLELNVLASLEKKFPDEKLGDELKAEKLAADFASLSKTEYKLDPNFKYDDDADYIDAMNYLHTYCKNIYKVDIDELVGGKQVNVAAPDINLGADAHADAGEAANVGGFMGAMAGMEGMEGMMNPFAYGKAATRLNSEVKAGSVYQFKTKPKSIPVIKIVLCVLTVLLTVLFLVTSVFVFIANGLTYVNSQAETKSANFITNGIFYLITAGFGCYVAVTSIMQQVKSKNNDNMKYSFTWFVYFGLILLTFLIPLMDLRNTWIVDVNITDKTFRKTIGFNGWKVLLIIDVVVGALTLIPVIIGGVKAPKVDTEKMQGLLKDYMAEFSPAPTPVAPEGADIQKPVEVKPTEPKKEEPKPDDKPSDDEQKS